MEKNKKKEKFPKCHKRAKTPTTLQMEALECGAASLCMILGYFKKFIPLEVLRVDCGVNRDGSKASNVKKAAIKHGLDCVGKRRDIESLKDVNFPAIVFWNFNHFVVLEGLKGDKAYLNDPASGKKVVTYEEFNDSYTGVILEFKKGENFKKSGSKPSMIPALKKRLAGFKTSLLFILLASLMLIIPGFIAPVFNRFFIDNILVSKMTGLVRPFLIAMGFTALLTTTLNYLKEKYLLRLEMKLSMISSAKFVTHLFKLPAEFFIQRMPGELVQRLDSNSAIANLVGEKLIGLVINIIMAIFFGLLMFFYDWVLALITVVFVLTNIIVIKLNSSKVQSGTFKIQMEGGKLQGLTMSGLDMIETLKASGSENDFFQQWSGQQAKVVTETQKIAFLSSVTNTIPTLINSILSVLILSIGAIRIMDGYLTIGMLMAFQTVQGSFTGPITSLMGLVQQILSNSADMTRVDDVLRYPTIKRFKDDSEEEVVSNESKPIPKMNGTISLRNVTFGYSRLSPPLITDLNLELTPGKRIALVGGSGSGKSTIGKLVSALYEPWSGEILFDGKPLSDIERKVFAESVSVVDQSISLFEGTIRDNITMWNSTIPEEVYTQAAKDACIHDVIMGRPDGYYASVSESGKNFSGGQRQRLEIARALAINPRILVMDEATSALDAITELAVDENIRRRGCTSIIIAHRLSTIRDADEIIVLNNGLIVQRGTHEELSAQDGLYKELIKTM